MKAQKIFFSNNKVKALILAAGAVMTMGNQKCQQKNTGAPQRSLKKIVELGNIRSRPIVFPNGTSFDFQLVANQQIYGVLTESQDFTLRYNPPIATSPQEVRQGDQGFFNLTKLDGQMLKAFSQEAGKGSVSSQYSKTAWCMVNVPQVKLEGAVNSFEMIGGAGISLGFTPAGGLPVNGLNSLGIDVQWAQLDLSMYATRPMTSKLVAASTVTSKQTKTKVNFALTYGAFSAGPSAYFQTPLAKVTKNALALGVNSLNEQLKTEDWYTRILANHDTHLVVVGGSDVGLEVGDQLLVYNEDYYWEGVPCESKYLGGGAQSSSAVAKIEIDWVGDEIARGRVIQQSDENAVIGAKVKLFKFHDPNYKAQDPGVTPVNAPSSVAVK